MGRQDWDVSRSRATPQGQAVRGRQALDALGTGGGLDLQLVSLASRVPEGNAQHPEFPNQRRHLTVWEDAVSSRAGVALCSDMQGRRHAQDSAEEDVLGHTDGQTLALPLAPWPALGKASGSLNFRLLI